MKTLIVCTAMLGLLPTGFAELTHDDFESGHTLGMPPSGWSTTQDTNSIPPQTNLFTVEAGVGRDGSQGLSLDVTQAKLNYKTMNSNGVSGTTLYLSADFQIATTGEALTNAPSGVNDPFIGPIVSTTPDWSSTVGSIFSVARRADDFFGFRVPGSPFVDGYVGNSTIGLAPGLTASTSDWFTITMTLTDAGSGWTGFMEAFAADDTLPFYTSPTYPLSFAFTTGAPLYGGFTTSWNADGEAVGAVAKVSAVTVDNVFFGPPSVKITSLTIEDLVGYSFTSITGQTQHLQYSMDGVNYLDTGASVAGDGSSKTLIDPASNTIGRTYRVISD